MLLAFIEGNLNKLVLGISIASLVLGCLVLMVAAFTVMRKKKQNGSEDLSAADGEKADQTALAEDSVIAKNGCIVMPRNVMYAVGAEGQIVSGKYVLKSAEDSADKFNLRFNGLVKEYKNGVTLLLSDGDTLCAVSGSVSVTPFTEE